MVKIQLDQGLEQVSADHVQPLESINYKFEPSKNNVLSSLHPMDENPRRHEQVSNCLFFEKSFPIDQFTE